MASTLEDLRARLQEQRAALKAVNRHINGARRARARQARAAAKAWQLTEHMRRVVLIAQHYALVLEPSVVYLKQQGRQRGWPVQSDEDLANMVGDMVLAADVTELGALISMEVPLDGAALKDAMKAVEEWRLAAWVQEQNRKGVTPSTRAVLEQFERRRGGLPEAAQPSSMGVCSDAGARKRASRWRRSWGGRLAALPVRDVIPVAEMREKAPAARRGALVGAMRALGQGRGAPAHQGSAGRRGENRIRFSDPKTCPPISRIQIRASRLRGRRGNSRTEKRT